MKKRKSSSSSLSLPTTTLSSSLSGTSVFQRHNDDNTTNKIGRLGLVGAAAKKKDKDSPHHHRVDCPLCGKNLPMSMIQAHLSFHDDDVGGNENDDDTTTNYRAEDHSNQPPQSNNDRAEDHSDQPPQSNTTTSIPFSSSSSLSALDSIAKNNLLLNEGHIENVDKSNPETPSTFDLMMRTMKDMSKQTNITFALVYADGKLHPHLYCTNSSKTKPPTDLLEIEWSAEVLLRGQQGSKLTVLTNIPPSRPAQNKQGEDTTLSQFDKHVPLLKSMLQKAVRRRQADKVAGLTSLLLAVSPDELLRRVPVIAVEDSVLHPATPVLVWLMVASSKGYALPAFLCDVVCATVTELALCPHCDPLPSSITDNPFNITLQSVVTKEPMSSGQCLIATLLVRCVYGGTEGDMTMLRQYASLWQQRLAPHTTCEDMDSSNHQQVASPSSSVQAMSMTPIEEHPYLHAAYLSALVNSGQLGAMCVHVFGGERGERAASLPIEYTELLQRIVAFDYYSTLPPKPSIRREHLVSEGVDFHCDSGLIRALMILCKDQLVQLQLQFAPVLMEDLLKQAIWLFRSSVSVHTALPECGEVESAWQMRRAREVGEKHRLREVWRVVGTQVTRYCDRKVEELQRDLSSVFTNNRNS